MTGGRLRSVAAAVVLAAPLLVGCEAAQQAQQGVDKAADCAGLVGELTGVDWNDVRQAPAQAEQAAQRLDQRLRDQVDLDTLAAELLAVVDQAVQPTRSSLWLRP